MSPIIPVSLRMRWDQEKRDLREKHKNLLQKHEREREAMRQEKEALLQKPAKDTSVHDALAQHTAVLAAALTHMNAPKKVVRDKQGKISHVETVGSE
jgi:hypothetical protein